MFRVNLRTSVRFIQGREIFASMYGMLGIATAYVSQRACHASHAPLVLDAHLTTQKSRWSFWSLPLRSAMISLLPSTLVLFSLGTFIHSPSAIAGNVPYNHSCDVNDQRLQIGTYQFETDCDYMTFCNSSSFCDWKKCRRDDYPFGYSSAVPVPPKCDPGSFCPDEQDGCQPALPVGSPCQFNRDGGSERLCPVVWLSFVSQMNARRRRIGRSWRIIQASASTTTVQSA